MSEKLSKFLYDNRKELISVLRAERYRMLELIITYLTEGKEKMQSSPNPNTEKEKQQNEKLGRLMTGIRRRAQRASFVFTVLNR